MEHQILKSPSALCGVCHLDRPHEQLAPFVEVKNAWHFWWLSQHVSFHSLHTSCTLHGNTHSGRCSRVVHTHLVLHVACTTEPQNGRESLHRELFASGSAVSRGVHFGNADSAALDARLTRTRITGSGAQSVSHTSFISVASVSQSGARRLQCPHHL